VNQLDKNLKTTLQKPSLDILIHQRILGVQKVIQQQQQLLIDQIITILANTPRTLNEQLTRILHLQKVLTHDNSLQQLQGKNPHILNPHQNTSNLHRNQIHQLLINLQQTHFTQQTHIPLKIDNKIIIILSNHLNNLDKNLILKRGILSLLHNNQHLINSLNNIIPINHQNEQF